MGRRQYLSAQHAPASERNMYAHTVILPTPRIRTGSGIVCTFSSELREWWSSSSIASWKIVSKFAIHGSHKEILLLCESEVKQPTTLSRRAGRYGTHDREGSGTRSQASGPTFWTSAYVPINSKLAHPRTSFGASRSPVRRKSIESCWNYHTSQGLK